MYKNLNPSALGISARQSELIEIALTYGFSGIDVDIADVMKRAKSLGLDVAGQLLKSAKLRIGGFELPIPWLGSDEQFQQQLPHLQQAAEVAEVIGAKGCLVTIAPASDHHPYHENFELHRRRLGQIAEVLSARGVRLGINFQPASSRRRNGRYEFIHQTEPLLTLVKMIGASNVGLVVDTWNWHVGGAAISQLGDLKREQIVAVRLANVPADTSPQSIGEQQRLLPDEEGVIDGPKVLQLLDQLGYTGPVAIAPDPSVFDGMTRDAIVTRARECLDSLWTAAGVSGRGATALSSRK